MKLIEACVRTELVDKVIAALEKLRVSCISVIDVKTLGQEIEDENKQFSVEYGTAYFTRSKIKVFCLSSKASQVFDAIKREAYTGHQGDGFISQISLENFEKIKEAKNGRK